jgi:hypothetical protein
MGQVGSTGYVEVGGGGISDIPTVEVEGVEGIPLIMKDIGVEALPMTFGFESVLITG